jgi:hypothetical protein
LEGIIKFLGSPGDELLRKQLADGIPLIKQNPMVAGTIHINVDLGALQKIHLKECIYLKCVISDGVSNPSQLLAMARRMLSSEFAGQKAYALLLSVGTICTGCSNMVN